MLILRGKKTRTIKKTIDYQYACSSCKSFGYHIIVTRDYYHLYFIPFIPAGPVIVKINCIHCGEPPNNDQLLQHYESLTRTPLYLYTGVILLTSLVFSGIAGNLYAQREKSAFIANPEVGDVYLIRKAGNDTRAVYSFLKIFKTSGDMIFTYHNNTEYRKFVIKFNDTDYFAEKDTLMFTRKELKNMLEEATINAVKRHYDDEDGFSRIR